MQSTQPPGVVAMVILEKVNNIAMGIEINANTEFGDLVSLHPESREGLVSAGQME